MDTADDAKDWGSLLLTGDWDVPPSAWAKNRANEKEEKVPLEKKNEKIEESAEGMTSSPLDSNWGKGLPAPSPTVAAHSTPIWRPWAEECAGGSWVEGRTVFVSNHTQNSMLPQPFHSPMPTFAPVMPSPFSYCESKLSFPNVSTFCPSCHARGFLTPA